MSRLLAPFLVLTFFAGTTLPNKPQNNTLTKPSKPHKKHRKVEDEPIDC